MRLLFSFLSLPQLFRVGLAVKCTADTTGLYQQNGFELCYAAQLQFGLSFI